MKKLFIFYTIIFMSTSCALAQREKWVGAIKIDAKLEANSTSWFVDATRNFARAVPFWQIGDYTVTDSREQWIAVRGMDWRPRCIFIMEGIAERNWNEQKYFYTIAGPNNCNAQCKLTSSEF